MQRCASVLALASALIAAGSAAASPVGDPEEGARVFHACHACHSLEPGEHRTGPSLAGVFGREAGAAAGFDRYSEALKGAAITWDEETLSAFIADPDALVPGNRMTFPGIADDEARADLVAYLKRAAERPQLAQDKMRAPEPADLRQDAGPENRVSAIRYCGDTYFVKVESGETHPFWEFNLRFKTDSSERGPPPGQPVLIPAGMMGDRAFVIFASPDEISVSVERRC